MKTILTCWGGVDSVTGSNFQLQLGDTKVLIDCGLIQGGEDQSRNKEKFPYDPRSISFLFVTHAHIDHIGRIPKLIRDGFVGKIYSTQETKSIAEIMFADTLKVNAQEEDTPMYEKEDVEKTLMLWHVLSYHKPLGFIPGASVQLKNSGHILGSAMVEFSVGEKKILFTGDLGNSPSLLMPDTESIKGTTHLIMESVYGDRNHMPKDERDRMFERVVKESIKNKRVLLIPAFSLERTQTLLYALNELFENNKVPKVPVFLDSPLAISLTEIYKNSAKQFNAETRADIAGGDDIFYFNKLEESYKARDSYDIDKVVPPKIIIAGSGMSQGGRITRHEALYLPHKDTTLLLTGYQAVGTLGRMIEDGAKKVIIGDKEIEVKATVEVLKGYSAHKDSDSLIEFVNDAHETLKKVFVVIGEPKASLFLVQRLRDYIDVPAMHPEQGKEYIL